MYRGSLGESPRTARISFTEVFRPCSKSTNVSDDQSSRRNSSRVTTSPARPSSTLSTCKGCGRTFSLEPFLYSSRVRGRDSYDPNRKTWADASIAKEGTWHHSPPHHPRLQVKLFEISRFGLHHAGRLILPALHLPIASNPDIQAPLVGAPQDFLWPPWVCNNA